ncbi:MAG: hypothetical protein ACK5QT_09205 [Oligoflexia bacterium]
MKQWVRFLFMLLALSTSAAAYAYVPPSEFILKQLCQKRSALKSVRIRAVVQGVTVEGVPSGSKFIEETYYDAQSGVLKSVALDLQKNELFRAERNLFDSPKSGELKNRESAPLVTSLLFESRLAPMVSLLRRWEIPIKTEEDLLRLGNEESRRNAEKTFLARQKQPSGLQVSWVIGDKSGNQLWIEKDTFLPSKLLLLNSQAGSEPMEFSFANYRTAREVSFPRMMTLRLEGVGLIREEVQEVTLNPVEPHESRGEARKLANLGFTEAGMAAESEVRELIRTFYKYVR